MSSLSHTSSEPATPATLTRPRVWAWPLAALLGFPIGGWIANLTVGAVDSVGAGVGEEVFFVRGKEASFPFHPVEVPVDAGIVGIVDRWDVE